MSLAIILCVLCTVCVWLKYVRVKSCRHALPPAVPGELPVIGHAHMLFKYFTNLIDLLKYVSDDCGKQGGVTYFSFGQELYYYLLVCSGQPDYSWINTQVNNCNRKFKKNHPIGTVQDEYKLLETSEGDFKDGHSRSILYKYHRENLVILDPEDALTAANSCTQKHYVFDMGKDWLGDGLITSSGDIWKRHRKLLTPAFTLPVVHGFLEVFNSQSRKLANFLEPHLGKGPFNHFPYLKNNSLETFCIGTFGINPIEDVAFTKKYMESVDAMINLVLTKTVRFWLQNDLIYRLVGLKKKEDEVLGSLQAMANTVLQKKKAAMRDKVLNNHIESVTAGTKYKPFLDLILDLSKNGALTDIEIRDEVNTTVVAGYETTSNQLASILVLLGAHPKVQEKVYEELLEVLGADRDVEKDDVNKLVYTNAVIMECLRMYPSVPVLLRSVLMDAKLTGPIVIKLGSDDGVLEKSREVFKYYRHTYSDLENYTMRAGSHCIIFPLATHLDPSWGAESDQFRPERWLDGEFRNNKEFAAFGLGRRACIGRTYAMISMKVTLAHILRRYRVTADMSKLKMKYEFILKPVAGHEIRIERRS